MIFLRSLPTHKICDSMIRSKDYLNPQRKEVLGVIGTASICLFAYLSRICGILYLFGVFYSLYNACNKIIFSCFKTCIERGLLENGFWLQRHFPSLNSKDKKTP
uniref:Uncharacterized protein n=1 Tax=Cyanoderma ruficeps TaxID=181631 RepID=A0A8C3RDK6_9PASS